MSKSFKYVSVKTITHNRNEKAFFLTTEMNRQSQNSKLKKKKTLLSGRLLTHSKKTNWKTKFKKKKQILSYTRRNCMMSFQVNRWKYIQVFGIFVKIIHGLTDGQTNLNFCGCRLWCRLSSILDRSLLSLMTFVSGSMSSMAPL